MEYSDYKIEFTYDKEDYEVGMDAYDKQQDIRLPNGKVLRTHGWLESMPPQPMELKLVENPDYSNTIQAGFLSKDFSFDYNDNKYCTNYKIYNSPFVLLPGGTILKATLIDYETKSFSFEKVEADYNKELANNNIIKADFDMPTISFMYENNEYEIAKNGINNGYLKLPDGRILKVALWLESYPPQPAGLEVIDLDGSVPVGIANFKPKNFKITYEDKEYITTNRIKNVQYILLPHGSVIKKITNVDNMEQPYTFVPATIDLTKEYSNRNLIKADEVVIKNKLRM